MTVKVLTSTTLFTVLFFTAEYLINKKIWRLNFPFLHRKLDFDGEWKGLTVYTHLEIESKNLNQDNFTEKESFHNINIKQDTRRIAITSSTGEDFTWNSLAINLIECDHVIELRFAYEVDYQSKYNFASSSKGLEIMKVIKSDSEKGNMPIAMSGEFYHCATGKKPIFRGKTVFIREGYLNQHVINSLNLPGIFKERLNKKITQ